MQGLGEKGQFLAGGGCQDDGPAARLGHAVLASLWADKHIDGQPTTEASPAPALSLLPWGGPKEAGGPFTHNDRLSSESMEQGGRAAQILRDAASGPWRRMLPGTPSRTCSTPKVHW